MLEPAARHHPRNDCAPRQTAACKAATAVAMGGISHLGGGSCHKQVTGNVKTLLVTIALFFVISMTQVLVAIIANSSALLVDSIAMGMDTLL